MPHVLGAGAIAAQAAPDTMTRDLVIITLPDPVDPITLYLATADVTVDGQFYDGVIRSLPDIVYSDGGNADGGEFTIENLPNVYGPIFLNAGRQLDGSTVVIKRVWKIADGTWQASDPVSGKKYQIGTGALRTQPIDDGFVKCHFTVDTSDSSIVLGDEQISQHCPYVFNAGGDHPLGGQCGWQVSMGGDPDFCDKLQNSPTGCSGHGNTRHGGVPGLTPSANAPTANPNTNPGGYPAGYPQIPPLLDPDNRYPFTKSYLP